MATRRLFDGAQAEIGSLPIASMAISTAGLLDIVLDSISLNSSGILTGASGITGNFTAALQPISVTASGFLGILGHGVISLGAVTAAATATLDIKGAASVIAPGIIFSATGELVSTAYIPPLSHQTVRLAPNRPYKKPTPASLRIL